MLCADGLGHVAWQLGSDWDSALELCALIEEGDLQGSCVQGVVMQAFDPVAGEPTFDVRQAPSIMAAVCSDDKLNPDLRWGCVTGAAYPYSRELAGDLTYWYRDEGGEPPAGDALKRFVALAEEGHRACAAHGDLAEECHKFFTRTAFEQANRWPRVLRALCQTHQEIYRHCLEAKKQRD